MLGCTDESSLLLPLGAVWSACRQYGFAIFAVVAAYVAREGFEAWVGQGLPLFVTFYPAVMVAALLGGVGAGLAATALSAAVAAIWIMPPIDSWQLTRRLTGSR